MKASVCFASDARLLGTFGAAQSMSPSGTFGFLANASQIDSNGSNGGAFLAIASASWFTLRENRLTRFSQADIRYVYGEFAAPCAIGQLDRLWDLVVS